MQPTTAPTEAPPGRASGFRKGILLKSIALAGLVMFIAECMRIFLGNNLHPVVAGKCYRSAQPTPALLESLQRTHGIRSIVNLRGDNLDQEWFKQEDAAAKRLHLVLFDAGLSSNEQPPVEDFRKFVQAVKDAQEPILIHCANGNDRTGLGSTVYLLMRTDTSIAEARGQLSLRYGHFALGDRLCLHRILDSYESWLAGKPHQPDHFYYWGMHVYQPEVIK